MKSIVLKYALIAFCSFSIHQVFSQQLPIEDAYKFYKNCENFELPYNLPRYVALNRSDTFRLNYILDLKMTPHFIYLTDYKYGGLVFKFDLEGRFLGSVGVLDMNTSGHDFKFNVSESDNQLYILNTAISSLAKFDIPSNQEISRVLLPYNVMDFKYSSISRKFVFYTPFNSDKPEYFSKALLIADSNGVIISTITKKELNENGNDLFNSAYNFKISNRLQVDEKRGLIMYSNLYSGEIFEISFDGSIINKYTIVASKVDNKIIKDKLDQIHDPVADAILIDTNYLINSYHNNKDNLVISSGFKNKIRNYVYDKQSGVLLELLTGVVIDNRYSSAFNFFDLSPDFSSDDYFIKVYNSNLYNKILSMVEDKRRLLNLPIVKDDDNTILLIYTYNNPLISKLTSFNSNERSAKVANKKVNLGFKIVNPVTNKLLQIEFDQAIKFGQKMALFSLLGEKLYELSLDQYEDLRFIKFQIPSLSPGLYIIQYVDLNEKSLNVIRFTLD